MEAVDPNLVKMATPNFDWINKGINSGMEYAQAKADLDFKKENVAAQLAATEQQKQLLNFQKGSLVYNDISKITRSTGPVRKAMIQSFLSKASAMQMPVSPETMALLSDESQAQQMQAMIGKYGSLPPEQQAAIAPSIGAWLNSDDPVAGMKSFLDAQILQKEPELRQKKQTLEETKAAAAAEAKKTELGQKEKQIAIDAAKQKAEETKNAAEIKRLQDQSDIEREKNRIELMKAMKDKTAGSSDKVDKLRAEAQKVETAFNTVDSGVKKALEQLKLKSGPGDVDAIDAMAKAMAGRATVQQYREYSQAGSLLEQITGKMQKAFDGRKFSDSQRAKFITAIQSVLQTSNDSKKKILSPIYSTAIQYVPEGVEKGMIFNDDSLTILRGKGAAKAPKELQTPVVRPAKQEGVILNAIKMGLTIDQINAQLSKRNLSPLSPAEYSEAKKKLGIK